MEKKSAFEEKNAFEEFIEGLEELNDFRDPEVKAVDEALAFWINKYFPEGFEFDYKRRNLIIEMVRKSPEMFELIMNSKFKPYIDALLNMEWKKIVEKEAPQAKKPIPDIDFSNLLMKAMRKVFVLGYCLGSLEKKDKKRKKAAK